MLSTTFIFFFSFVIILKIIILILYITRLSFEQHVPNIYWIIIAHEFQSFIYAFDNICKMFHTQSFLFLSSMGLNKNLKRKRIIDDVNS